MKKIKISNKQIVAMIHPEINNVTPILPKGFSFNPGPVKSKAFKKAA